MRLLALLACAGPDPVDPPAGPREHPPVPDPVEDCLLFVDADRDGFGDPGTLGQGCVGDGVLVGGDCDDADPGLHPTGEVRFTDATAEVGLAAFLHWDPEVTPLACANEQMVGGLAVGDLDGDGWPDVFLPRVGLPDVLLHNDGGTFTDIAALAGVDAIGHHNGALMFDLEGDGDLDLFVTSLARDPHRLYVNDGSGVFTEEAALRGVDQAPPADDPCGMSFSANAGDVDRDGDLDLHLSAWQEERDRTSDQARLFLNDGTGVFTDATLSSGLDFSARATFTGTFLDVDDDLDPDLLSVADWRDGALYLNAGDGTFAAAADAGVGGEENGMGSAVGDPDEDGDPDWFVSSVYDDTLPCPEKWGCTGNRLYLNDGGGVFADGTEAAGVRDGGWGWGASFLDYDLDGHQDLVQVGGFPVPGFEDRTSRLWRGLGDGRFEDGRCATGLLDDGQGRAVVPFDADRDGDPDVLVVGNAEVPRLWRNDGDTGRRWLAVAVDPSEVGSRVQVTTPSGTQTRWIVAGGSFLASGPYEAAFGLGDAAVADVDVRWPDGSVSRWTAVPADGVFDVSR